ncbi:S24 family peptidase [Xanthobacter sp. V4C-4]|uniref:S24 family peptidase n=1 Tax=Xanthobacter cornucopiae TaxID=3119924 RepID=UPI00372BDE13
MPTLKDVIEARLAELNRNPFEAARIGGLERNFVNDILIGKKRSVRGDNLAKMAAALDLSLEALTARQQGDEIARQRHPTVGSFRPEIVSGAELVGNKDFPIYAAAAGGSGHLIVTFDAIEWVKRPAILEGVPGSYGLLVYGDSMSPAYRHGDMALIHPGLGPAAGRDVVLYDHPPNGDAEAIIKHLVTWTELEWRLEQYNPPKAWTELRGDWPTCHRVVGKYDRR